MKHEDHYRSDTGYEAWDVIEAWRLNFNLGNVCKYLARLGHKAGAEVGSDLVKIRNYLQRELEERVRSRAAGRLPFWIPEPGVAGSDGVPHWGAVGTAWGLPGHAQSALLCLYPPATTVLLLRAMKHVEDEIERLAS
jgi:hypothetical protein